MTSLNVTGPGGVLASYSQNYSFSGHKQSVMEGSGRAANYTYDSIYRLTNESIASDPGGVNGTLSYSLDAVANRLNLNSTLAALPPQALSYDADDRLNSDAYDANGNTVASGGTTYGYEFEDRLTSTSSGVQIAYDGHGNRISETVSGTTTKFLVDELTPTGYSQVAEELVNSSVTVQYTHGVMRISQRRAGVVSYYGYDPGGSVRQLTNAMGGVTDIYVYDAFGNTIGRTGTTVNPYQYRGEQFDSALGMYYLRSRYYYPRIGRLLTRDRFQGHIWWPLSQQNYAFVLANPVDLIDPSGFGAEAAVVISLSAESLAIGAGAEVTGTLVVQNGIGLVSVDLVQGLVAAPFSVLPAIAELAVELGAEEVWLQAVLANARLEAIAALRYGAVTYGGRTIFQIFP